MGPFSGIHAHRINNIHIFTGTEDNSKFIPPLPHTRHRLSPDATGNSIMSPEIINLLFSEEILNNMVIKKTQIEPLKVILRNKFNNKFLNE